MAEFDPNVEDLVPPIELEPESTGTVRALTPQQMRNVRTALHVEWSAYVRNGIDGVADDVRRAIVMNGPEFSSNYTRMLKILADHGGTNKLASHPLFELRVVRDAAGQVPAINVQVNWPWNRLVSVLRGLGFEHVRRFVRGAATKVYEWRSQLDVEQREITAWMEKFPEISVEDRLELYPVMFDAADGIRQEDLTPRERSILPLLRTVATQGKAGAADPLLAALQQQIHGVSPFGNQS